MSFMVQKLSGLSVFLLLIWSCKPNHSVDTQIEISQNADVVISGMLKAIEADPENPTIWFEKATYLYEGGQFDQALKDFKNRAR